jgi:DNA polymerase-4
MEANLQPIMLRSFPSAIVHVDGDAFFASVEQAVHPEYKGRPVVTGKERGIIASASYEAKRLGVARGVPLYEARRKCPSLVVLPSDYETYSLYSKRMFDIMRRYTPIVEEYSIDEGFADLLGVRRVFRTSYEEIVRCMQEDIHRELDITVSCGLSLTKSLAKLASKFQKPRGLTVVPGHQIHLFLRRIPLDRVWGFGPNTVGLLTKQGLQTAWDFVSRPEAWAARLLGKAGRDIWRELRGEPVYAVEPDEKSAQYTLCKGKTFTPPSRDREFVYAQLVRNVESAFIKLRRHRLRAKWLAVALRHQDFREDAAEAELSRPTSATLEVMPVVRTLFDELFSPAVEYRATMIVLGKLEEDREKQQELFEDNVRIERMAAISRVVDEVNEQFGKHKLSLGPSLFLTYRHKNERGDLPWRKKALLKGETFRKRLNIPRLGISV